MTPEDAGVMVIAGFGAAAQEFVHWYNLRTQLSSSRYRKTLRSPSYWVMVVGMILVSGVFTWAWYRGDGINHLYREYLLTGAAFPLILKKAAAALAANTPVKLGDDDSSTLTDYLLVRSPDATTKEARND